MICAATSPALGGLGYPTPTPSTGTPTGTILTGGAAAGVGAGLSIGLMTGSIKRGGIAAAGATLAALAPLTGPAAPFVAAIGGIVTTMATMFKGCGASCTETSKVADQAATAWEQIKTQYWAQPVRTKSSQAAALAALDSIASELYTFCSNPAFGDPGKRCISERLVRGGSAPWCPTKTGCDFYTTIYDPIANDAGVVNDPVSAQVAEALGLGPENGNLALLLLLGGGLLLAGVML